jgi:hypothetical protein
MLERTWYRMGLIFALIIPANTFAADLPSWVTAMREVHERSVGDKGVLLHLGDSITYSMAYFAPLQYAKDAKMATETRAAWETLRSYLKDECFRWKGPEKGNYSGQTAAWGLKNVDSWLSELKPEVALIMFGTNDIRRGSLEAHETNLRSLIKKCLDNGVVVILSTIPPMHGFDAKVHQAVEVQRKIASDMNVPLIDFYAHVLNRRPDDWDGTLTPFDGFSQWEVPTLISKDGVHPSNPQQWRSDYTEQGLCRNGNILRSYLTLMAYVEVINVVVNEQEPTAVSTTILGSNPPRPADTPQLDMTVAGETTGDALISPPVQDWFPQAPPLPDPNGAVIDVSTVQGLFDAAENVTTGGTIRIANGLYHMPQTFYIRTDNVTLRSRSGQRTDVVLDFAGSRHHEGVAISNCSGVTIADLTVQNVRQNGIKINSNQNVDNITIYNVIGHNVWQRHIKGPKVPDENGRAAFVENCRVQYCLFYNDRAKRRGDEPWEDSEPRMGFNYIGGMDIMSAKGWIISDNVFTAIRGKTGEARGAIFMWHNATDCVIERNILLDCDTGICLGNSSARGERRHANGVIVRNNFIIRCSESNILADHTRDCQILNNTVHDPDSTNGRLLRAVHANDGLKVANNIFSGPRIVTDLTEGKIDIRNNLIQPAGAYFVDADKGDLHLTAKAVGAIDQAASNDLATTDIDKQRRDRHPDLGADEFLP